MAAEEELERTLQRGLSNGQLESGVSMAASASMGEEGGERAIRGDRWSERRELNMERTGGQKEQLEGGTPAWDRHTVDESCWGSGGTDRE